MRNLPNIVLIYTDQQRWDTLGINGNPHVHTPNLDRIGEEGTNFTNSFVPTPLCMPERVSLFTGRYAHAHLSVNNHVPLSSNEQDFATLLRQAGYSTALIGKNHCFTAEALGERFDYTYQANHMGFPSPANAAEEAINTSRAGKMQLPRSEDPVPGPENTTSLLFQKAMDYSHERASAGENPFFLWLSIPDPHPPYMVSEPYAHMYRDTEIPSPKWEEGEMLTKPFKQQAVVDWNRYDTEYPGQSIKDLIRAYWGMVSCIDDGVGKLMESLKAGGILDNTIVIFTTDHGDYMGDHRMIRKGPHVYDALTRVPLIVYSPLLAGQGNTKALVSQIDLFPTLFDYLGLDVPTEVHGRSFLQVLTGEQKDHREYVLLEHGEAGRPIGSWDDMEPEEESFLRSNSGHHLSPQICRGRSRAVRTAEWKYVCNYGDTDELYDLVNDPHELTNVIGRQDMKARIAELRGFLLAELVESENDFTYLSPPAGREQSRQLNTESSVRTMVSNHPGKH
jgi:arylsulfatase A-like enzyme